jgi:hypothetical protein
VDRVQANHNTLCKLSGHLHLRYPTPFWLPQHHHYGPGIQFPLTSVISMNIVQLKSNTFQWFTCGPTARLSVATA